MLYNNTQRYHKGELETKKHVFIQVQIDPLLGLFIKSRDFSFRGKIDNCKHEKMITHSVDDDRWFHHFEHVFKPGATLGGEEPEL